MIDTAIPPHVLRRVIDTALEEDAPWGDVTSDVFIPADATATATLTAREPGVFSGGGVFAAVMAAVDPTIKVVLGVQDGCAFAAGDDLATVHGSARAVLRAERVALNLVQRMSGIATTTARYVAAVAGTDARVVDTRKTTPGLRALERHAVRCGGAHNHRTSLSDAVLAKDNHLAVIEARGIGLGDAVRQARAQLGHTVHLEVEVDRIDQIEPVVAAGVDTVMLDNFTPAMLREGVAIVAGRALVEASGGVDLGTIAAIAATGVDVISVGALTHSARALDLGLDVVVAGSAPAPASASVEA
ncbi:carboxylating nicotinate-nucleotide diphosphorylase [Curtobacterium sp. RRHDQ10]|uniref:carboxylating nicotinate-nucleotide diphosphorylase n=1 Tax=Curtobacterium phyllosphaerae TaxID=3413379 RepID=UPI003BF0EDB9